MGCLQRIEQLAAQTFVEDVLGHAAGADCAASIFRVSDVDGDEKIFRCRRACGTGIEFR